MRPQSDPPPARQRLSRRTALLAAAILIAAMLTAIALSRLTPGAWDDAYISFVYAKNSAAGRGLTYNGTWVQGYTNALWVLILAGAAHLGFAPPGAALVLGWCFGAAAVGLTYWLGRRCQLAPLWAVAPAALLAVVPDFAYHIAKGLETPLFACLLTATAGIATTAPARIRHALVLGMLTGLTALCRPEGVGVALVAASLFALRHGSCLGAVSFAATAAVATPWYAWAHAAYGAWLPNPVFAKVSGVSLDQLRLGISYLLPRSPSGAAVFAVVATQVAAVLAARPRAARCLAAGALAWCAFIVGVGGDNIACYRFLVPVLPMMLVVIASLATQLRSSPVAILLLAIPLLFITARWTDQTRSTRVATAQYNQQCWSELGIWFKRNAPPGSLIAVNPAGIIPYVSELPTIDMLGLNDAHIAHHGTRDPALRVGHQVGDGAYVLDRRPDYIMLGTYGSRMPSDFVSDRQIGADPRFSQDYVPVTIGLRCGQTSILYRRVPGPPSPLKAGQ